MKRGVFFGSGQFAKDIFDSVCAVFDIVFAVSRPDKPFGRKKTLKPTPLKEYAVKKGVEVFDDDTNIKALLSKIKQSGVDYIIVADYGRIIEEELLKASRFLTIGVHPSLLPAYRGAAPISWALIEGKKQTGVSFFQVIRRMDAGDVIFQRPVPIAIEDNYMSLYRKLVELANVMIGECFPLIAKGEYSLHKQDEAKASFAPRILRKHMRINWQAPAENIYNLIRGAPPKEEAWCVFRGRIVKVLDAYPVNAQNNGIAGSIVECSRNGLIVLCGRGAICLKAVKPAAKNAMSISDFCSGQKPEKGEKFE